MPQQCLLKPQTWLKFHGSRTLECALPLKYSQLCRSLLCINISWWSPWLRMHPSYQAPCSQELGLHLPLSRIYGRCAILSKQNSKANWFSNASLWIHPVSSHPWTLVTWQFLDKWVLFLQEKGITYRVFSTQVTWVHSSGSIFTSYLTNILKGLYLIPGFPSTQVVVK